MAFESKVRQKLPYSLDLDSIRRMDSTKISAAAVAAVKIIPSDDWFGKTTLNTALMDAANRSGETEFARQNLLSFISAVEKAWGERFGRKD